MNINSDSRFAINPVNVDVARSRFERPYDIKTTFNAGELIPFYVDECYPGDTHEISTSKVVRLQTLLDPIMDSVYLDTYFFFVPNRLLWSNWKRFMGESGKAWVDPDNDNLRIPQWKAPAAGIKPGSLADYLGLPITPQTANAKFNALPFRAYAKICEDWFRSTPTSDALNIPDGDADMVADSITSEARNNLNVAYGWKPFIASKLHDCYTSCLPSPQRGSPVTIQLADSAIVYPSIAAGTMTPNLAAFRSRVGSDLAQQEQVFLGSSGTGSLRGVSGNITTVGTGDAMIPMNLRAKFDEVAAVTVEQLRQCFQIQRYLEKNARGGDRYISQILTHFGVTSPDARMQRSEYLGGHRTPINVHEVVNTSENTAQSSFLGNLGAVSRTSDVHEDEILYSCTEHGWIIGLCVARYHHSYPQGCEKFWLKNDKFDYYFPEFANIGEVAVSKNELYYNNTNAVFGYQEAWYEMRYKPWRVTSEMRPDAPNSLASWHLADNYATPPTLSDSWLAEDKTNLDRCLAVTSSVAKQFFVDIYVMNKTTRILPMFSIPGLIDHH